MIKKYIGYIQECDGALLLPDRCAGSEIHPAVEKKSSSFQRWREIHAFLFIFL